MSRRQLQRKVCLLGSFAVGKTSLARRFVEGVFDERYLSSIGVTLSRRTVVCADADVKLILWDLAGGDEFRHANQSYLRGAAGALLVCDLTRPETLDGLDTYAQQLRALTPDAQLVLLANKVDLADERAVGTQAVATVAATLDAPYWLTSAKTGRYVADAFNALAERLAAT